MKEKIENNMGTFMGLAQLDLSDLSSKVPISMKILRSTLHFTYHVLPPVSENTKENSEPMQEKIEENCVKFTDIESIMIIPTGFLIDLKTEYMKLVLDNDSTETIAEILKEYPKKMIGINFPVKTEYTYNDKKIVNAESNSISTKFNRIDGITKEIRIHIDQNTIIEENVENSKILRSQEFSNLSCIEISLKSPILSQIKLFFEKGTQMLKYQLKSHECGFLISNIISTIFANISSSSDKNKDDENNNNFPIVLNENSKFKSRKIQGIQHDLDNLYTNSISKLITEIYNGGDYLHSPILSDLILDASINTGLKNEIFDPKYVQVLFGILAEFSKELKSLEENETAMQEYYDFISKNKEPSKLQKGVYLYDLYRKIPNLLLYLRNQISLRNVIPEISIFKAQLDILLSLAGAKDSVVSFMASMTLRILLKVFFLKIYQKKYS